MALSEFGSREARVIASAVWSMSKWWVMTGGDIDGAAGDEVEGEWVGVGVSEGARDGEFSSLDEGDVDAHLVGAHADQAHPTRSGQGCHASAQGGPGPGALEQDVELAFEGAEASWA